MHRRMLGNGYCARPVELDCHFESICESCTYFVTSVEFRPTLTVGALRLHSAAHDGRDHLVQGRGIGRAAFPVSEQEVDRTDEHVRDRRNVGGGCYPVERLLLGQVSGNPGGGLGDQRKACRPRFVQALAQAVTGDE